MFSSLAILLTLLLANPINSTVLDPCSTIRCKSGYTCTVTNTTAQCTPVSAGQQCGPKVCALGDECCNESCGTCTPPGGFCTQQICEPTGPACGKGKCYTGQVCCNASCGICTPPGGFCTMQFCG
ncbi:hypothetical protein B0T25DRAFT_530816 [Lasiosphaeria hispida]|uniref:Uncharacterized protein n=1 Tax=Lasiosphaeria hispida TaxID=260671 RepID=A0AAJ0HXK8_9PEZI|nr:hypothetical protein B0T25DRAFT_530816 [Lasiosphaeria hispida]